MVVSIVMHQILIKFQKDDKNFWMCSKHDPQHSKRTAPHFDQLFIFCYITPNTWWGCILGHNAHLRREPPYQRSHYRVWRTPTTKLYHVLILFIFFWFMVRLCLYLCLIVCVMCMFFVLWFFNDCVLQVVRQRKRWYIFFFTLPVI